MDPNSISKIDEGKSTTEEKVQSDNMPTTTSTPQSYKRPLIETAILCIGLFGPLCLATLDTTIIATALPHIASSFSQLANQSWIANAYILTSTAFMPVYGQFADIFGRHIATQSAIFIFLVGSAFCTGAQTWGMLLAGRAIAGIGAAGCLIMTRIIMSDHVTLKQNARQNGLLIFMFAIAFSVGPVIGGELTSVSWLAINLPVCVASHLIFFFLLRKRVHASTYDTEEEHRSFAFKLKKIDYLGLTFFLGSCVCIILALVWGGITYTWHNVRIIILLILGGILATLFVIVEWFFENDHFSRAPRPLRPIFINGTPMIPLEIFRDRDVSICQWTNFAGGMIIFGQFYYIAIYFTIVFSYSPQEAGKQLLYFLPGLGAGTFLSIFLVNRVFHGTKSVLILGSVVMTVACSLFAMAVENRVKNQLYGFMAMLGVGVGLTMMPSQLHSQARMMHHLAVVASLISFFRTLGGIIALTLMSSVVNNKIASSVPEGETTASLDSLPKINALPLAIQDQIQSVLANGIRWAYIALIPFAGISVISTVFLREVKIEKDPDEQRPGRDRADPEAGNVPRYRIFRR